MKNKSKGFIATTAVIVLGLFGVAVSANLALNTFGFADSVFRRELRLQTRANVRTCLDISTIILSQDRAYVGPIRLREFGCTVEVRQVGLLREVRAWAEISGIKSGAKRTLMIDNDDLIII